MVSATAGVKHVLWTEAEVVAHMRELAAELAVDLCVLPEPPVVGGIATGVLLFLADLIHHVNISLIVDFMRIEPYGTGTESCGAPWITSDLKVNVIGKHVVMVSPPPHALIPDLESGLFFGSEWPMD
jgi:hypoxanthine phosphoribosyltransferase